jgi:hypothetical protein
MAANAVTHQAIEAFIRTEKIDLTPWEVRTICRVDDAIMDVWARDASPDGGTKAPEDVKATLKGIAAMKKASGRNG